MNNRGFTLIEVLIAITLTVVIGVAVQRTISETYKLRDVLQNEGDFYNSMRLAMDVFGRDVGMIYNPELMLPPKTASAAGLPGQPPNPNDPSLELQSGELSRQSEFWNPAADTSGIRPMRFIGSADKISFVSASHVRLYKDAPESDFIKVRYSLRDEKELEKESRLEGGPYKVLLREISTHAFSLEEKDEFKKQPLMRGIVSVKFSYYNKPKNAWVNSWDSGQGEYLGIYPDIVKIVVEAKAFPRLSTSGIFQFRPEAPLYGIQPTF